MIQFRKLEWQTTRHTPTLFQSRSMRGSPYYEVYFRPTDKMWTLVIHVWSTSTATSSSRWATWRTVYMTKEIAIDAAQTHFEEWCSQFVVKE